MKTALVLACDDNFVPYASVVARRAAGYAREKFPIVIVSDGVTDENKRLALKFCPQISFTEASHVFAGHDFRTTSTFTRATYLRLYLDEILADFDRIAYIDSDMTPLVDLSPLLNLVPRSSPVMATYSLGHATDLIYDRLPLSREAGYLQGGLQIYDIKAVREERIFKTAIEFAHKHPEKCELVDQDAMNVVLQGRWQVVDWRWNVMNFEARHGPKPFHIRHHGGGKKPWSADKSESEMYIVEQWRNDLSESPWPHKFMPRKRGEFVRQYFRPVRQAVKAQIKAASTGDFEAVRRSREDRNRVERYLQRLPLILQTIEDAAAAGRLAKAL
jgi:lipopolysaccharide biosynthesis glycosyltransferase